MNKNDRSFLELLEKIIELKEYRYKYIQKNLIEFIKHKYTGTEGHERLFYEYDIQSGYNLGRENAIFLIDGNRLKLSKSGKEKKKESEKSFDAELTLSDYTDESKFIIGLGQYGHTIYDSLKEQELKELTQATILKQTQIQEKQSETLNNQTKILNATFWIYTLMASAMIIQIAVSYFINSYNISPLMNYGVALLILAFILLFSIITKNLKVKIAGELSRMDKFTIWAVVIAFIAFLILSIIAGTHGVMLNKPSTRIDGEVDIKNIDKIIITSEEKINKSLQQLEEGIVRELYIYGILQKHKVNNTFNLIQNESNT